MNHKGLRPHKGISNILSRYTMPEGKKTQPNDRNNLLELLILPVAPMPSKTRRAGRTRSTRSMGEEP